MSISHLLMCKPTYFDVAYSINPWMKLDNPVDKELAARQWDHVYDTLRGLDVKIDLVDPVPGLLDMTFSGDCGMVVGKQFLCSNFRHPERQGETKHYAAWMEAHGYEILRLPEHIVFEGLGDVVYHDEDILFGYGPRSDPEAAVELRRLFPQLRVRGEVFIQDVSFFHVALAAAFLTRDVLLYYPPAFDEKSRELIRSTFPRAIAVSAVDANDYFICNNIVIGDKVLLDNCSPESEARLRAEGFEPIKCDMSEYKKSGGSLRCLVLKL